MALLTGSAFKEKVYAAVREIPDGCVATYGQIAEYIGCPGAARAVGNALHVNPDPVGTPCFRIVNSQGRLAPHFAFGEGIYTQKQLLEEDGIEVTNYRVDLERFQWRP